jgi:hypothetical protein
MFMPYAPATETVVAAGVSARDTGELDALEPPGDALAETRRRVALFDGGGEPDCKRPFEKAFESKTPFRFCP